MLSISTRFRVQESKTPLGVMPADSKLGPEELLRAFKQANPKVWAIKNEVCRQFPVLPPLQQLLVIL